MTSRITVAKLFLACLAGAACVPSVHAQQPSEIQQAIRGAWGFDRSDLTPHPGVKFGVLPNGLRYALMRNAAPAGGLSIRLRLDGGAMVEGKRERGFMHLLEHLVFHGTANIPEGALPLMLAPAGLDRWADFNAFTSFDETVYQLDLSRADRRSRATAMMLMREIATNLRFTRRAVEGAKHKVQAEIRTRDAVRDRIATEQNAFFMPGTPIARGAVAGTEKDVERARGAALQRLYDLYYTPRRATLILVGDVDPALAESEIKARFSDWEAPEAAEVGLPPPSIPMDRGTQTRLLVDPAAPTIVTIAVVGPIGGAGDEGKRRDASFLERLASKMLNRRLARISETANGPFLSAEAEIYDYFSTARVAEIEVEARDRNWRSALQRGAQELRRALDHGFSQAELDEQLAASRQSMVGQAAPQTSSAIADAIVDAVGRDLIFTAPADRSATQAYLATVGLAEVNAAFRTAWASTGRLIFASHNRRIPDAKAAIAAAWTESMRKPVADPGVD